MLDENLSDLPMLDHFLIEHGRIGGHIKHLWRALEGLGESTRYFTFRAESTAVATLASQRSISSAIKIALLGRNWHLVPVTRYSLHDRGLSREYVPSLHVFLRHTGARIHRQLDMGARRDTSVVHVKNLD